MPLDPADPDLEILTSPCHAFLVQGTTHVRPFIFGNSAVPLAMSERVGTDHTHRWTVSLYSPDPSVPLAYVRQVDFTLHETYKNAKRGWYHKGWFEAWIP